MPDARVQAAIDHWAPRFVWNGVDYNDFVRTTRSIERWEDWLDAWGELAEMHLGLARDAEAAGHALTAGEAFARAAVCFHFSKFVWVLDPERNREHTERARDALYDAHRLLDPGAERVEAPFESSFLAGNLRRPAGAERPPLVVLIPGLDSTKEEFFLWENTLLARGLATLSIDGPGQGETRHRGLLMRPDYEVALAAMLDAVAGADDLDLERVGAAGISLGGYHVVRACAFEPRVSAVVSISGPYALGGDWDDKPEQTKDSYRFYAGAQDDGDLRERVFVRGSLAGVAERLQQPAIFMTGKLDRLVPWQETERAAREAPNAEFVLYEHGNHGCANVPYLARPLIADFFYDRLAAPARVGG